MLLLDIHLFYNKNHQLFWHMTNRPFVGNQLLLKLIVEVKLYLNPTGKKHTNKHNTKNTSSARRAVTEHIHSSCGVARNISNRPASSLSRRMTTLALVTIDA